MSKSVKELVDNALDDVKEKDAIEENVVFTPLEVLVPRYTRYFLGTPGSRLYVSANSPFLDFPDTLTDQTHALTIAEQVRRGQGDADKPDPNAYDFPDGKDDGSDAHGIFEFSERVDQWIAEQNLSDELRQSFRQQVLSRELDKAQSKVMSENDSLPKDSSTQSSSTQSSATQPSATQVSSQT